MEEIQLALTLKAQLDALRPINKEQEGRIMQKFRLDWNYHSNHLEGNSLTYGETKALILHGITAQGRPFEDSLQMRGHNEAINWVLDMVKGERPLTENFIRELHTLLLKEPYEVDAQTPDGKPTKKRIAVGSYKTTPNHVKTKTGEIFYFATPEETPAEMAALMDWYREKSKEENVNPIFLAAEFHYKFIRIHPFDDGNGRTARILMNFILMQFGYPPVVIKTEDKENYFAALQLADTGNIEAFITYIAQNLVRSLEIMIAGAKGEDIEEPDDLDKEIALLEQRLNSFGEKSNDGKGYDSIMNCINLNMAKIVERTLLQNERFKKFYISNSIKYIATIRVKRPDIFGHTFNDEEYELEDLDNFWQSDFDFENILGIQVINNFSKFNTIGFDGFDYKSIILFVFSDISYSVYADKEKIVEKPYNKEMSETEINRIVKSEAKRHKEFIEKKIAEKEK